MKKLLTLLFALYFLSSPSVFADDISDFQIEGISIGDSLLDYMTEDEILEEFELRKDFYSYLKEPNKYAEVFLSEVFSIFDDGLSFIVKNNPKNQYITDKNEKYTILFVRGMIRFIEDIDGCIVKRDEIVEELSMMFPNTRKTEDSYPFQLDPSGNSMKYDVNFVFDSGDEVEVSCDNFEETLRIKNNYTEGLNIVIVSKEILDWASDY